MYVAYVALVAITNLLIGFMLATILGEPREILSRASRGGSRDGKRSTDDVPQGGAIVEPALESGIDKASEDLKATADSMGDLRGSQQSDGTWTEITSAVADRAESFETSLSALAMRIDAGSGSIAGEVAAAVKQQAADETTKWLSAAEQIMESLSTALKAVPNGKSILSQCERVINEQLAQSETSFSNLTMIDLTAGSAAEAVRFSQELKRLAESCAQLRSKLNKVVSVAYQS
jgi:hypothetical protein